MEQRKIQLLATDPRSLWTPAQLPGILHWWRADLGITESVGQVSQWVDQVNGKILAQSTGANQPDYSASEANMNGQAALDFTQADSTYLQSSGMSFTAGEDMSIIVIKRHKSPLVTSVAFGQGATPATNPVIGIGASTSFPNDSLMVTSQFQATSTNYVDAVSTDLHYTAFTYDATGASTLFSNEEYLNLASPNTDKALRSFDPLLVGAYGGTGSPGNFFDGYISEVIVTKSYLREQDLNDFTDYINFRYGVATDWSSSTLVNEKVYLDTYPESPLLLNLQIDDYQELPIINSDFSRTFRIPATGTNNKFFEAAFNINSTDFDVSKKVPCDIIVDGEFFRRGQIRLNKIFTNEFSDRTDYEIFFLGESKDFASQVGEGFLNSLLCFDLDHELLMSNIITSWDAVPGTTNGLLDGNVLYPLADYGYTYEESGGFQISQQNQVGRQSNSFYSKGFSNSSNPIQRTQFRPWIRAKYLIDKIFSLTDYTYTSAFFDSDRFDQMYVNATGNSAQPTVDGEIGSQAFSVSQGGTTYSPTSPRLEKINFPIEFSDPTGVVTNGTFTALTSGTFDFDLSIVSMFTELPPAGSYFIQHEVLYSLNGATAVNVSTDLLPSWSTSGTTQTLLTTFFNTASLSSTGYWTLSLNAGDTVEIYVKFTHGSAAPAITQSIGGADWSLPQPPFDIVNPCALLQDDVKIIDFFKSIINQFKLVVAPDPNNAYNLVIEPYNDYIGSGVTRDWTEKLDTGKDFQIEPIFFNNSATIFFQNPADEDIYNNLNLKKFKESYGTYIYDSAEELLGGSRTLSTIFSPTPMTSIIGAQTGWNNFILPRLCIEEVENEVLGYAKVSPIRPSTRLLFYNGLNDPGTDNWYYVDDAGATQSRQTYGLISPYEDFPTVSTSLNLNWEIESPYYTQNASNEVNLGVSCYDEYWADFIESQYNPFARKLIGYFILDHYDLKDFQFKDIIFVKDSYYRVLKIENVPLGEKASVKVELLKLLDYAPDFALPTAGFTYSIADDGLTVTFTNTSTDATSYLWDFGDGSTSTATNPVYAYDRVAGTELFPTRTVTLTATNVNGSDVDSQSFQVETTPIGTQAWWRASDGITLNGSNVSNWVDNINSISLNQSTAAQQPLYNTTDPNFNNEPSISFDRVQQEWLASTLTYSNYIPHTAGEDVAIMYVFKTSYTGNQTFGLMSRTGGTATFNGMVFESGFARSRIDNQIANSTTIQQFGTATDMAAANWMAATYEASTGAYSFYRDNTSILSGTGNINGTWASTTAYIYAGAFGGNGVRPPAGSYYQGELVEMWVLHHDLTATDRTNFAAYLSSRYNL